MKFCKIADITDWQDQEFQSISSLLQVDEFRNRKVWEHIQVYRGLLQLGLLNENTKALGLGSGRERLIYAFANQCGEVIATDLYNSHNWPTAAMAVNEVYQHNSFPYRRDRLTVRHMDMTQIEYPDASFDVVWSCCAIEHVNSFRDLHQVYREIHRVLKPNGIAAITTEYNLTDRHSYEPNMLFTDRFWIEHWLTGDDSLIQGFALLDQPDLTLLPDPGNEPQPRRRSLKTSIPIYSRDIILNSVSFFLRKVGEFSRSYDDSWLPPALCTYLMACEQQQGEQNSEQLFKTLLQDATVESRLKVAALRRLVVALRAQNRTEEIVQWCQQVIPLCKDTRDTDHLLPLANQCKKLGLWTEAKLLYETIEQSPGARDTQVVRSILGQADYFAQLGQWQAALKQAERASQQLPVYRLTEDASIVHYYRGLYYEKLNQLSAAIDAYQSGLNTSESSSKIYKNCLQQIEYCSNLLQQQSMTHRFRTRMAELWKRVKS